MVTLAGTKSRVMREDLDFGVVKKHLFIKEGKNHLDISKKPMKGQDKGIYADRFALWNQKDDTLLSVISSKYHPVEHGAILNSLEEALDNLKLEPMSTNYYATPNRNLAWVDVQLLPRTVEFTGAKDDWNVGVSILHGLDGVRGLQVSPFIQRVVCSNGMRTTKMLGRETKTHRTSSVVEWFESTIRQTLESLDTQFSIIPKLYEVQIEIETFEEKVQKLIGKRFMESVQEEMRNPSSNNPLYNVGQDKVSLYDALNAMTYVNRMKTDDVGARILDQRHRRIEGIVNSYITG